MSDGHQLKAGEMTGLSAGGAQRIAVAKATNAASRKAWWRKENLEKRAAINIGGDISQQRLKRRRPCQLNVQYLT